MSQNQRGVVTLEAEGRDIGPWARECRQPEAGKDKGKDWALKPLRRD